MQGYSLQTNNLMRRKFRARKKIVRELFQSLNKIRENVEKANLNAWSRPPIYFLDPGFLFPGYSVSPEVPESFDSETPTAGKY